MNVIHQHVVASWSGGIDSTGVVAWLLRLGYFVHLVTLKIYGGPFGAREKRARTNLYPILAYVARTNKGMIVSYDEQEADWLWAFSPDGREIPRRNKHILDHLVTKHCMLDDITNVAMGEYIGADTWVVKDHVAAADADHRSLAAYLYYEYGINYRFMSLADFGESRFKSDRLRLLIEAAGEEAAHLTTNCLYNGEQHCGRCYKCIERAAAFDALLPTGIADQTQYTTNPRASLAYSVYSNQMKGADALDLAWTYFEDPHMPERE